MIRYLTELSVEAFTDAACSVPYQQIHSELFPDIDLWIRRDDLIDPLISGNKAYKLLYNLLQAREQSAGTIVTCGGAWSNHIHATAAAGQRFGLRTIGIIRGERPPVLSAMLQDAERFGMELRFVSRNVYRARNEPGFLNAAGIKGGQFLYVPEGGANEFGARGVRLLAHTIAQTQPVVFDECWLACGTGLTLGALGSGALSACRLVGVAVLNAAEAIDREARRWSRALGAPTVLMETIGDAHCGGYARSPEYLRQFVRSFELSIGIQLDPIYTAKLAYALHSRATNKQYSCSGRVLMLHTGGIQGLRGRYTAGTPNS